MTDPSPHLFWITSRAAGTAALLLSSLAVCVGLLMSGRMLHGRRLDMRAAHEAIALATIVAIAVHALALLGDAYLHPSLADVTVPFASSYKTAGRPAASSPAGRRPPSASPTTRANGSARSAGAACTLMTVLAWVLGARALARRGNRCRAALVSRDGRDRGGAGRGAPLRARGYSLRPRTARRRVRARPGSRKSRATLSLDRGSRPAPVSRRDARASGSARPRPRPRAAAGAVPRRGPPARSRQ